MKTLDTREILNHLNATNIIPDKGFIGRGIPTPTKTRPGRKLIESEENRIQHINHIRSPIKRAIAHLKT